MVDETRRRLLLAESEPSLRRLISNRFAREGYDVVEVTGPTDVVEKLASVHPSLVLLELGGPVGLDPLLAVREVSDVAVIGLLWPGLPDDEATVLELGADDCMVRPLSFRTLVARCRAVTRRIGAAPSNSLRHGPLDIDLAARIVTVWGEPVDLTAREFDLLAFLASHPNEVFTREQLLATVWRSSADWQQRETVTEHIHRLRARLEDDPARPQWLITVRGVGYRFRPPSDSEASRSSINRMTPFTSSASISGVVTTRQSMR